MSEDVARTFGSAPSLDDMALIADAVWRALPEAFRRAAGDVIMRVDDFPDDEILKMLGIEDPFGLTGLYEGLPLPFASETHPVPERPRVFLYRRPILDEWADNGEVTLEALIEHVLVHEVAHHFGWSDAEIDAALDAED